MAVRRRRKKKTINPRFAALCLALVFFLGAAVYLAASRGLPGEDVQTPDYVEKDYLTVNECPGPARPLEDIRGVVIHYVGNPGTTARANRNYFESLSSGEEAAYASSHFVVGLEGEVIQCIPLDGDRLRLQRPQRRHRVCGGLPSGRDGRIFRRDLRAHGGADRLAVPPVPAGRQDRCDPPL